MHFILEPKKGAKPLQFGMKRDKVRNIFHQMVYFTKPDEPENDFYETEGLILGYDEQDQLEFVEIISPSTVEYKSIHFFKSSLSAVLKLMNNFGHSAEYEDGGYNFKSLCIALYCPENTLESVSIYKEGYYDDL